MNIGRFDMLIIVTMSLSIILMSMAFTGLGLVGDSKEQGEGDIPEFNITSSRFDYAGDFPKKPGTASQGTLAWGVGGNSVEGKSLRWIDKPKTDGVNLNLIENDPKDRFNVTVVYRSGGGTEGKDRVQIFETDEDRIFVINNNTAGWVIEFDITKIENWGGSESTQKIEIEYEVLDSEATEGGGFSNIPVLGDWYEAGQQLAATVGYVGLIIRWAVATLFEAGLNTASVGLDLFTYAVDIFHWMLSTYFNVVDAADSWAGALLMAPGVMLFVEFVKIGIVGINILR